VSERQEPSLVGKGFVTVHRDAMFHDERPLPSGRQTHASWRLFSHAAHAPRGSCAVKPADQPTGEVHQGRWPAHDLVDSFVGPPIDRQLVTSEPDPIAAPSNRLHYSTVHQ